MLIKSVMQSCQYRIANETSSITVVSLFRSSHPKRVGNGLSYIPMNKLPGLIIRERKSYGTANEGEPANMISMAEKIVRYWAIVNRNHL